MLLSRLLAEPGLNVQSEVLEDLQRNQVENGNDIRRVLDHLAVDLRVERLQMQAIDFEVVLISLRNVAQARNIVRLGVRVRLGIAVRQ